MAFRPISRHALASGSFALQEPWANALRLMSVLMAFRPISRHALASGSFVLPSFVLQEPGANARRLMLPGVDPLRGKPELKSNLRDMGCFSSEAKWADERTLATRIAVRTDLAEFF